MEEIVTLRLGWLLLNSVDTLEKHNKELRVLIRNKKLRMKARGPPW